MLDNSFSDRQQRAVEVVDDLTKELSEFHRRIWSYAEPAWREYRSAAAYIELLRAEGFEVEEGSGGMPTAFCARWGDSGPTVGLYAEYDATPGYSQDTVTYRQPRSEFHPWAPGFTDAHCALGVGALAGALSLKRTLESTGGGGQIRFFGEPAEKVCGSKAVHALKGYFDNLDFSISYHPLIENAALGEIQNCLYWSAVFTFECPENEPWIRDNPLGESGLGSHNAVRSPGAIDALGLMLSAVKYSKENMFPRTGLWSLNEAILGSGTATADNLSPRITQLQLSWRSPLLAIQNQILDVLVRNAKHVAGLTNSEASIRWVTRIRPGLKNMTMSRLVHDSMTTLGVPEWPAEAYEFARELERSMGHEPSEDPFRDPLYRIVSPEEHDAGIRTMLPSWQDCTGADDYTEYTWHTPTVRFFTAKPLLKVAGEELVHWANNAMNGYAPAIDPTWIYAGKTIATTALRLLDDDDLRARAREEYEQNLAAAPEAYHSSLLPPDFEAPIELPWPEYHETARGFEWGLPTTASFGERIG